MLIFKKIFKPFSTHIFVMRYVSQIPSRKLNAIMSDSASSCKKARSRLVSQENNDFMHLLQYRCQAHLFNLIGAKMMAEQDVEEMFTGANKLVGFISSYSNRSLLNENTESS